MISFRTSGGQTPGIRTVRVCPGVAAGGHDSRQGQGLTTHTIIVKDECLNVASMFLIG